MTGIKKTFDVKYLKEELELPWEGIYDEALEEHRWSVLHLLVFRDPADDLLWEVTYNSGTGDDGEAPWEYDTTVVSTQVEPYEVTVTKYREVVAPVEPKADPWADPWKALD